MSLAQYGMFTVLKFLFWLYNKSILGLWIQQSKVSCVNQITAQITAILQMIILLEYIFKICGRSMGLIS